MTPRPTAQAAAQRAQRGPVDGREPPHRADQRDSYRMSIARNSPFAQGLLYQKQRAHAATRRQSPRGQAGHLGGLVTARTYPNSRRPRATSGRFAPEREEGVTAPGYVGRPSDGSRRRGRTQMSTAHAALLSQLNDALAAGDIDAARRHAAALMEVR